MKKTKSCIYKKDIILIILLFLFAMLGLALSILFIYIYSKYNNVILNVIFGVISYFFMMLSIFVYNLKSNLFDNKFKWPLLIPLIYTLSIFLFISFLSIDNIIDDPIQLLNNLMYSIYLMPAFVIVIFVAVICCLGM